MITPLFYIFQNQSILSARISILKCIQNFQNLTSAWDVILDILKIAATDENVEIVTLSFLIIEKSHSLIPLEFSDKHLRLLLDYCQQTADLKIPFRAISLALPLSLHISLIDSQLLFHVQSLFYHSLPEVTSLSISLYYNLLSRFALDKSVEIIQFEFLFPIFSTDNPYILQELTSYFFLTFIPNLKIDFSCCISQITQTLFTMNDPRPLYLWLNGFMSLPLTDISCRAILQVLQSKVADETFFTSTFNSIPLTLEYASIFDSAIEKTIQRKYPQIILNVIHKIFLFYTSFPEERKTVTQTFFLSLLKIIADLDREIAFRLIEDIHSELLAMKFLVLTEIKNETLLLLFEFFDSDDSRFRGIIKQITFSVFNL